MSTLSQIVDEILAIENENEAEEAIDRHLRELWQNDANNSLLSASNSNSAHAGSEQSRIET